MKKNLIFLLTIIFLAACTGEEKKEDKKVMNDLKAENLKGDIASIEEAPYKTDSTGKTGEIDSCCISVTEYDANGNSIKWTSKDNKGTVKEEQAFERYANGLWKGSKSTKDGKPSGSFETTQDDKGNYVTATVLDSAGKLDVYYTGITQNENGQVLSWKQYDKDSVFRQEGEVKYENHVQTGFTLKDSVGNVKQTVVSKYNDKGEQTENSNTTVTKDSTTTKVTKYTYDSHDEQGNWTQRTTWDEKGKATAVSKRTYNYRSKEAKK
jgi:hypothetical protein